MNMKNATHTKNAVGFAQCNRPPTVVLLVRQTFTKFDTARLIFIEILYIKMPRVKATTNKTTTGEKTRPRGRPKKNTEITVSESNIDNPGTYLLEKYLQNTRTSIIIVI